MVCKNIVLCSDGTGNSDTERRGTNVFKLYEAVDIHGHLSNVALPRQIAFYDDGVGTENFALLRMIGAAFGYGFAQNIRDLYTELVHVYNPGDKLFLFGFSRGAYTIRALSGMIQYCGVLDRVRLESEQKLKKQVRKCWRAFRKAAFPRFITPWADRKRRTAKPPEDDKMEAETAQRRHELGSHRKPAEIAFVGVWDTVGAVGMPIDFLKPFVNWICPRKFDELTPGKVERACHALAIDDERATFHPELWNERGAPQGQVEQVWFAGVHSNVGGGYAKHGMSLVTLDWMMNEAVGRGLRFNHAAQEYVRVQQDVHSKLYDSRSGVAVYYRWKPRNLVRICREHGIERPKVHASVFERIATRTDGYAPGNIPAGLEIVGARWTPERNQEIEGLIRTAHQELGVASLLESADVKRYVGLGKLSYFGFLALSIVAVLRGLYQTTPVSADATWWERIVAVAKSLLGLATSIEALWNLAVTVAYTWWFIPGLLICYVLSRIVDNGLERQFSSFWHNLRARLEATDAIHGRAGFVNSALARPSSTLEP